MPVPLNAFVDVVKAWFTERLDYLVNDSVPVKPDPLAKKAPTPSDIDLVCKYPQGEKQLIRFECERAINLSPNLLVECKGWFDYNKPEFYKHLRHNLSLLKNYGNCFLPKSLISKTSYHLFFFREEVFEKGIKLFGSKNFQRVVIGPFLKKPKNFDLSIADIIAEYEKYNIIVIEIREILCDLFKFIQDAKKQKKTGNSTNADKLRKTYALEMLHLVDTYFETRPRTI